MTAKSVPLWLRLAEYVADRAGSSGALRLDAGELLHAMGTDSKSLHRAMERAKAAGWLDARSNPRALVVPPEKRRARVVGRP